MSRPTAMRRGMKLAKDIEVGDELLGSNRERNRVIQVQLLPAGDLMVTWHTGGKVMRFAVFKPEQVVTEYADEFPFSGGPIP